MAAQQDTTYKVILKFSPTEPDYRKKPQGARNRMHHFLDRRQRNEARDFKRQVLTTGPITFSPEEMVSMQAQGALASDYKRNDINPAILAAAHGIDVVTFAEKAQKLRKDARIPKKTYASLENSLLNSAEILQSIYIADEYLYTGLREINQRPQVISMQITTEQDIRPRGNQMVFNFSPDTGLQPVMDLARPITDKVTGKAKDKLKGKVKGLVEKGAKRLGKKAGMKAFEKISGQVVEKAVTALAAETGPLAPLIGKLAGFIYRKLVSKALIKLKKAGKYLFGIGLGLLGLGVLTSSPFLIVGGLGIGAIGGLGGGIAGIGAAISGMGGLISSAIMVAGGSFLGAFIVAIILTPFFIALILFIITTSAYIVPGGVGSFSPDIVFSEFLDVEKSAAEENTGNPGPFSNDQLPLIIEYTVSIKAKDDSISNIRITDTCDVIQESGSRACPRANPPLSSPPAATVLEPGESLEFTYIRIFNSDYNDAWVGDVVRVLFDTPEEINEESFANAIIKIGDPPDFCPSGWPLPLGGKTYYITQGAYGPYSHVNGSRGWDSEALDISGFNIFETDVYATHKGQVEVYETSGYGKQVRVVSTCEGRAFFSLYAHLNAVTARPGTTIEKGEKVGEVGSSGNSSGAHLHYEFRYLLNNGINIAAGGRGDSWLNNPPYMMIARPPSTLQAPFYLPKNIPRECTTRSGCNASIP